MVGSFVGQVGADLGDTLGAVRDPFATGSIGGNRAAGASTGGGFASALDGALQSGAAPAGQAGERSALREKIHGMAEELVSGAFVRPVLAKLRETNQAAPPFAPGLWEKTFGPLMDEQMGSKIVESSRFPLVDALTDQLMAKVRPTPKQETGHG